MKIPRRNFFATLLAPILARLAPKPKPDPRWPFEAKYACSAGTGWMDSELVFDSPGWVTVKDWYLKDGNHYRQVGDGPRELVGDWRPTLHFSQLQRPDVWPWEDEA